MPDFRVSKAAQKDIREIGRYTQREWGTTQRRNYLAGMDRQFAHLARSPLLAAERSEFDPPVRIFPYEKHLIVYRAEDTGIFIIRVSHESMDITSKIAPHRMA